MKSNQFIVEIVPQLPDGMPNLLIDCNDQDCEAEATVMIISASQGHERPTPFCSAHAHVVFADWMVGL